MIPIPKGKRLVVCDSNNFRQFQAIALSNIIGKVLDWIILKKEEKSLYSLLQFCFKQGVSTTQATHVVNETISYYNFNKSTNVHLLLLNASNAFDRVEYSKLFQELLNHNVTYGFKTVISYAY